jgi:hypothetical protein
VRPVIDWPRALDGFAVDWARFGTIVYRRSFHVIKLPQVAPYFALCGLLFHVPKQRIRRNVPPGYPACTVGAQQVVLGRNDHRAGASA